MSQYLTTITGTYAKLPLAQSEDGDFVWALEMFDGDDDSEPTDLTDCEFSFEVFDMAGVSLNVYEIGSGITVLDNLVTLQIPLEDWEDWRKNCGLGYEYKMTTAGGLRRPLFSDTLTIVA